MPTEELINRKNFLMKMGFGGAALMAVLTSCVNETSVTPSGTTATTGTTTGTTTTGTTTTGTTTTGTTTTGTTTDTTTTTNDLLTIDLTNSAYIALTKVGGYVIKSNIVIALVATNTYAAVTQVCSHEGKKQVIYQNGEFYCTAHGARYTTAGKGLNSDGRNGLTVYKTSLVGNILHITA